MSLEYQAYHHQFRLVDSEWYEQVDRYQPTSELIRIVRAVVPADWQVQRYSAWFQASCRDAPALPHQGWKIHVSATPPDCQEVLKRSAEVCAPLNVTFKFLVDRRLVQLTGHKGWSREASGKFVTIYPRDDDQFFELLDLLRDNLGDLAGPFVLSDRRYQEARCVYYRYGGISGLTELTSTGERQHILEDPAGGVYPDLRVPFWHPPPWVTDPFEATGADGENPTLREGRYRIERALSFSATGGVYLATDGTTGRPTILKEARPGTAVDDNGNDAVFRLQKEYQILKHLMRIGVTPRPVDLFQEWEHWFLVEEFVPGLHLGAFCISANPIMRVGPSRQLSQDYLTRLLLIWGNLADALADIHGKGIVCGDLSLTNVLVEDAELGKIRIIDMGEACDEGVGRPGGATTPGFALMAAQGKASRDADYFALGSLMLGTLFPINNLLDIEPGVASAFVASLGTELGLSGAVRGIMTRCLDVADDHRPSARQVADVVRHASIQLPEPQPPQEMSGPELGEFVDGVVDYILESSDPSRSDRLFPADPLVFYTNPLSIAYGATGVAYALARLGAQVPSSTIAWILSRSVSNDSYPPSLYTGLSGIAWGLLELGLEDVGIRYLKEAGKHPLLFQASGVFHGAAGFGMACLRAHLTTGIGEWLERAASVGDALLRAKVETTRGSCWPDADGSVQLGYSKGAAGIALYLLYLSLATGESRFLSVGEHALAHDRAYLRRVEEGHLSTPRGSVDSLENVVTHYWLDGSAGIGTVLLRFWVCTASPVYFETLEQLAPDTYRKYTVFPGLFRGLSGLGNFLLDAYATTGEEVYLRQAHRVATGVSMFRLPRDAGAAFPGEQLLRISTDFGTGSAGIGLFLHRLQHAQDHSANFNLVLDALLPGGALTVNPRAIDHPATTGGPLAADGSSR